MNKVFSALGLFSGSIVGRIAILPGLASFGIHVLLLSWLIFYDSSRWAHINWAHVIPCLILGLLAFSRASKGAP